jgi:pyrophosphatase PpaX
VTRPKPDAEPVTLALSLLGVDRSRAVMVGDSPHDLQAGRAAGVATAAVTWGAFSLAELLPCTPDHVLHHPSEFVSLADG